MRRLIAILSRRATASSPLAVVVFALLTIGLIWWLLAPLLRVLVFVAVAAATCSLVAPDANAAIGRGDSRPWLVRLREHHWRRITGPFGWSLPRSAAYAALAIGWWWLLR